MTTLREAATQALEAMLNFPDDISDEMFESITALKAALEADNGMYGAKALTKAYENGWNAAKADVLQDIFDMFEEIQRGKST